MPKYLLTDPSGYPSFTRRAQARSARTGMLMTMDEPGG
jgi:hypothetical protein